MRKICFTLIYLFFQNNLSNRFAFSIQVSKYLVVEIIDYVYSVVSIPEIPRQSKRSSQYPHSEFHAKKLRIKHLPVKIGR